jgi:DHA2 family multidrug resistance protein-like MFS transporter
MDWLGAALNALALGFVVIGVDTLGTGETLRAGIEIAIGLVALALLILQQRRRPLLLPLDLMRIRLFALSFFTSSCSYAAQMLAYVSLPFLFQSVLHRSQVATGLLMTPWPLLVAVSAILAGRLTARYPASILGRLRLLPDAE